MGMSGLGPIAALLLLSGKIDVNASAISETRVGTSPIVASQPPLRSFIEILTPELELDLLDHAWDVRLAYMPRIFYRQTEGLDAAWPPLVLHVVNLTVERRPSAVLTVAGFANASVGAIDYTYLQTVLGPMQASLPQIQIPHVLSLVGGATVSVRLTPLATVRVAGEVDHHEPIGNTTVTTINGPVNAFPTSTFARLAPALSLRVSRVDDAIVSVTGTLQSVVSEGFKGQVNADGTVTTGDHFELLTVAPQLGWARRLSPGYDLHLSAGAAFNHVIVTPAPDQAPSPLSPVAGADLTVHVLRRHEEAARGRIGATVDYYVDPILHTTGPRGTATTELYFAFPGDWMTGLSGTFSTSLSTGLPITPQTPGAAPNFPDETAFTVNVPLRHRVTSYFIGEIGGRWSDRGPRLTAPEFHFHQRQLWVYLELTATTRLVPRWLNP
jgi:hypothetical protein